MYAAHFEGGQDASTCKQFTFEESKQYVQYQNLGFGGVFYIEIPGKADLAWTDLGRKGFIS